MEGWQDLGTSCWKRALQIHHMENEQTLIKHTKIHRQPFLLASLKLLLCLKNTFLK